MIDTLLFFIAQYLPILFWHSYLHFDVYVSTKNFFLDDFRYKLVASEWSECKVLIENTPSQPTGGNNGPIQQQMASSSSSSRGSCGGGIRTRNVSCVLAYKNQPIDDSFCIDLKQIHRTERWYAILVIV